MESLKIELFLTLCKSSYLAFESILLWTQVAQRFLSCANKLFISFRTSDYLNQTSNKIKKNTTLQDLVGSIYLL